MKQQLYKKAEKASRIFSKNWKERVDQSHKKKQGAEMNLFDSSAAVNLCREKKIDKLLEGWTLNLAFYELGNAVWKQANVHKTITTDEANTVSPLSRNL